MEEVWNDIPGYEGKYQISNLFEIRSLDRWVTDSKGVRSFRKGRKLKPGLATTGYYTVNLSLNGITKTKHLHRLIAEAFIPNPENKPEIDHINGDRKDNRLVNLRWCTHRENLNNPIAKERHSKTMLNNEQFSKEVEQYTKDGILIAKYPSIRECVRQTGSGNWHISECCNGKRKSAGGYIFKFAS